MKPALIIIGLGNPGMNYALTRHNTGFLAIDTLAKEFATGPWSPKQKFLSDTAEARIVAVPILLVKPQTFMNRSGEAIQKLLNFYHMDPAKNLLILCDDIDLGPGMIRMRKSGGPGTHNGLKSIVDAIGESFPRIRIGIGAQNPGEDLSNYVLSRPTAEERKKVDGAIRQLAGIVKEFVLAASGL